MGSRLERRALLIGVGSGFAAVGLSGPALPLVLPPVCRTEPLVQSAFWPQVAASVFAGWLVEALKNYGLVPGTHGTTMESVRASHERGENEFSGAGWDVTNIYQGAYSAGDCEMSHAIQADGGFYAFSTTDHTTESGSSICSLRFRKADIFAMRGITDCLLNHGIEPSTIEACSFPMHVTRSARYNSSGHEEAPEFQTPNGGTVSWHSTQGSGSASVSAEIRTDQLSANVEAHREGRRWKYTVEKV